MLGSYLVVLFVWVLSGNFRINSFVSFVIDGALPVVLRSQFDFDIFEVLGFRVGFFDRVIRIFLE